jgi:diaminohydroxyphosphoribosylaminopyrimidine deaminase / 5-amino-6-(5-phosphoribosylamino)uracil reductase
MFMRRALRLAKRGYGSVSPNPMVGAVLTREGKIIGEGWHRQAGGPHAEIEALQAAQRQGESVKGATMYVTLEPCSTHGLTPPCTKTLHHAGIRKVFCATQDPNPRHSGKGFDELRHYGIELHTGLLEEQAAALNAPFNHWIVTSKPWVLLKSALTLDGKIATPAGESKWITNPISRRWAMRLRQGADAILTGVGTILSDDPSLTVRLSRRNSAEVLKCPRRFVMDTSARIPLRARALTDDWRDHTTVIVGDTAPRARVHVLKQQTNVWIAPVREDRIDPLWVIDQMAKQGITSLMVEGGGEINHTFLFSNCCQRVAFFYAPKILRGSAALKAVAGPGAPALDQSIRLTQVQWRKLGADWLLMAIPQTPGSPGVRS